MQSISTESGRRDTPPPRLGPSDSTTGAPKTAPTSPSAAPKSLFGAKEIWERLKLGAGGPKKNLHGALANDILLEILAKDREAFLIGQKALARFESLIPPSIRQRLSILQSTLSGPAPEEERSIALLISYVRLAHEIASKLITRDLKEVRISPLRSGESIADEAFQAPTFLESLKDAWYDFKLALTKKRQWLHDLKSGFFQDIKIFLTGKKLPVPDSSLGDDNQLLKPGHAKGTIFGGSGNFAAGSAGGMTQGAKFYGRTENGLGLYKPLNEDAFFVLNIEGKSFFVVIDEMGARNGSGEARLLIAAALIQALGTGKSSVESIAYAEMVTKAGCAQGMGSDGMGAAVSILELDSDTAKSSWLGDVRVRHFAGDKIRKLTFDHRADRQNMLSKCLGISDSEILAFEPDSRSVTVKKGDVLAVYSDGISELVSERRMARILATSASLEEAFENIWRLSSDRLSSGGRADNRTLLLVQCLE